MVAIGIILPFSLLAAALGFTPLSALYFLFLPGMTALYLLLVQLVKQRLTPVSRASCSATAQPRPLSLRSGLPMPMIRERLLANTLIDHSSCGIEDLNVQRHLTQRVGCVRDNFDPYYDLAVISRLYARSVR